MQGFQKKSFVLEQGGSNWIYNPISISYENEKIFKGEYDTKLFEQINTNLESINRKLGLFYWLAIIILVIAVVVWIVENTEVAAT